MNNEFKRMQELSGVPVKEEKENLNEHYVAGGIVGVGAINNPFEGRKKESYEDAFEYFLSKKYSLKEAEEEVMVDSNDISSNIDKMISLADDMEYTPEMIQKLEALKSKLSNNKMSVEDALNIMQQTINITGDDIDAIESLGQAVDYDDAIIAKAREIKGLNEGEVNEAVGSSIEKMIDGAKFEFSQKGNDEMIELANYILTPEGAKNVAMSLKNRLKSEGGENYYATDKKALQDLLDKLK